MEKNTQNTELLVMDMQTAINGKLPNIKGLTGHVAGDQDYGLTVLYDYCANGNQEVHRVLTTKVFPRQAKVLTAEEWTKVI